MKHYNLLDASLDLFDGGSAGGDGGASAGSQAAPANSQPGDAQKGGKTGGQTVLYGKQEPAHQSVPDAGGQGKPAEDPDAGKTATEKEETPEQRKARFLAMANGEFKDIYGAEIQRIINDRFKASKQAEEQLAAQKPLIDLLAQRYGVQDAGGLMEKLQGDEALWSAQAQASGMEIGQFMEIQKLRYERDRLMQSELQRQKEDAIRRKVAAWNQEAEAVRAVYPEFDMGAAVQNPQFMSMLQAGVPIQHAYEVLNLEKVKSGVARQAAAQAEKSVVESIRAKGSRPSENGTSSQSGVIVKSDVSKLTRADRADIARRAARGEKISF